MGKRIEINLFGSCIVRSTQPSGYEIRGAKHKALFALLATAPFGRRTRAYLQETLWGVSTYDTGRQSLRRALSDIKQIMGADFDVLLSSNNLEVSLDLNRVTFIGHPGAGQFLEGLDLPEKGFAAFMQGIRDNPAQIYGLFSPRSQAPLVPLLPVVAILPFRALGGEANHAILGDWLAEELCRSLSRSSLFAVISHLSARAVTGPVIDTRLVRSVLHADYCLTGSLRPVGGRLIVDADLIDTRTGRILSTRRFTATQADFFQPDLGGLSQLVHLIGRTVADEALTHVRYAHSVQEVEDHRLMIAGVTMMHRAELSQFARARELIAEALQRSPLTAEAHAWLAKWYVLCVINGWSSDPAADTAKAIDSTARALDICPDSALALSMDGFVHNNLLHRLDLAEQRYANALTSNPNESLALLLKGCLHAFRDEGAQAVALVEQACSLSPADPFAYFYDTLSATAYLAAEDYGKALVHAERSIEQNDRHLSTFRARLAALHHLGRHEEARQAAADLMQRQPGCTVDGYMRQHPAADFLIGRRMAEAMRASGIP